MASPIIASSTDSSLDDLCRAAFDGEPWQCTPELVRNFYRSFHRFLLGPSFASALRRVSQRAFYSSPPLLFDVYRAIADTMQDARESVGAPNEASIARGTSSLERLRTVDIAGEDDALAILALGQTLAAHDLLTNCNGCVLIMRYSLSCAEPWYGRLARDASLDPITTSTVFWDIVCCLVRGQMPVVKPQVREEGAVDRLAGLCTTMLPILYDLAVALNKASAARTGGAEAETTSFRNIEAMLRAWTPTPPENFDKRYTEVERLRMRAQASMYRSAALLVAHRAMHEFGTADDIARAHANHILHELSTHEELLGPDLCLRHIGFPLFTVAVEVPELSSSLLHKIDLLDVAPTARQQMGALVDYVWAQRNSGFRGYLHQLVQRGPTFVAVP
ncbi:uncharacterized protein HMPREF1541_05969 [Cyphellophora europaea CBS 101466]|uniref:Uncharacterized protein n=1 Tax=Cyphellophora europaea (strain CBS 101466) TaxID=1220924 RepID=W2RVD9_CYPE1|nr:uncharacterized protein HMPREF1541_05969 [Cyphellophora europaea CBS 101466]ETN39743.1 hypothetical protein HMPREF1541_05969 [Cyphellophora europaea CBS 101466]